MTICARLIIEASVAEIVKLLSMKNSLKNQIALVSRMTVCAPLNHRGFRGRIGVGDAFGRLFRELQRYE